MGYLIVQALIYKSLWNTPSRRNRLHKSKSYRYFFVPDSMNLLCQSVVNVSSFTNIGSCAYSSIYQHPDTLLVICLGVEGNWFLRFLQVNSSREWGFRVVCILKFEPLQCIFYVCLLIDPDGSSISVSCYSNPQIG